MTTTESTESTEKADERLPRETGAEKAEQLCPVCGSAMQVTTSAYGSTSAECPKCRGEAADTEKAREGASESREVGTKVTTPVATETAAAAAEPEEPSDG